MNVRSDLTVLEMCGFSNSSVFSYPENGSRFLGKVIEGIFMGYISRGIAGFSTKPCASINELNLRTDDLDLKIG